MGEDEAALVRRSRGGDLEAFGALVTRHGARVQSLAGTILGLSASQKDIEESAMDVFARAWRDLILLSDDQEFPLWLDRLTVTTALARPRPAGHDLVDALPGPERAVARLYFTGGLPVEEIACLCWCSVGEVWARLHDGCRRLR